MSALLLLPALLLAPAVPTVPAQAQGEIIATAGGLTFRTLRDGPLRTRLVVSGSLDARRGGAGPIELKVTAGELGAGGWGWAAVSHGPDGWLAALEWQVESSGPATPVLRSADGLRWFLVGVSEKPHYMARVTGFRGRTEVMAVLDDCAGCGVTPGTYAAPLEGPKYTPVPFSWLAGTWVGPDGAQELWSEPAHDMLVGAGHTGGTFEYLRVVREQGTWHYDARPNGRHPATRFTLAARGPGRAVFTNATHDFPQRIEYQRVADTLRVAISRLDGTRRSAWTLRRR
jgi:hypothetical protein